MFGWLGGYKFQDDFGYPNLGLLDQKAALEWVRNNIYRVGGGSVEREVYSYTLVDYSRKTNVLPDSLLWVRAREQHQFYIISRVPGLDSHSSRQQSC